MRTSTTRCWPEKRLRRFANILRPLFSLILLLSFALIGQSQNINNINQFANGKYTEYNVLSAQGFQNGNLNEQQSHYIEGHSIPYRIILDGLTPGQVIRVRVEFDLVNSSRYALDFVTGFQQMQPHNYINHSTEETVNPGEGTAYSDTEPWSYKSIDVPSYLNSAAQGAASAKSTFEALTLNAGELGGASSTQKKAGAIALWGGVFNAAAPMNYSYREAGTPLNADQVLELSRGETKVAWEVTFTVSAGQTMAILAWGGHIARKQNWGDDRTAGDLTGSPYHYREIEWAVNGNTVGLGAADRSLKVALSEPTCPEVLCTSQVCNNVCPGTTQTFSVPTTSDASGFSWSIVNNTANASFVGGAPASDDPDVSVTSTLGGAYTVRVVLTNGSGFATTCQQTVNVTCSTPTIGGQGANASIECPSEPSFTAPTASDACGSASVQVVSTVTGGTACARTHTRTWRAANACGNFSSTVAQTITVRDVTAPSIGSAGGNATINCPTEPSFTAPTASDACSGATVNIVSTTTGGTACARTHTRVWQASDGCGNLSATRAQTITVVDATAPTIGAAGANATVNCLTAPEFTAPTASDACSGATVNIVSTTTGGTTCARTHTRVWNATDACGNASSTVSQTILVIDNQAPSIGGQGSNSSINCPSEPSFTAPTASDACSGATVNIVSTVTGGTACARTHTRTWSATDGCGNVSGTVAQTITVRDVTAPSIGGQGSNSSINCPSEPSFTAPTASDACSGATVNIVSTVTGGTACARTHTRTWSATDGCGNVSGTVAQTITVRDVTAPSIGTAGSNATINCPSEPSFTAPTASDECSGATVNIVSTVTGGTACARTHTRTWSATDGCGNVSGTVAQTITVRDVTAPSIGGQGSNSSINCPSEPSFTAPTASDACSGATVNIVSTVTGGTACARTHTRTWSATDGCGNVSGTVAQTITVRDVTAPSIGTAGSNATINCPSEPSFTAPTASDACSGATVNIVSTMTAGGAGGSIVHTRVWSATDGCGNVSVTRSQAITVLPCLGAGYCTYTQGYYGNPGGKACNGTDDDPNKFSTSATITEAINSAPFNGTLVLGAASGARSITISSSTTDVGKVIEYLPGGGSSYVLTNLNQISISLPLNAFRDAYTEKKGSGYKINNTLLAQTMTLGINLGIKANLAGFGLEGGKYLVTVKTTECGSEEAQSCEYDEAGLLKDQIFANNWIDANVVNYSAANDNHAGLTTIWDIYLLANKALAGDTAGFAAANISLASIAGVADAINNAFDGCRLALPFSSVKVECAATGTPTVYAVAGRTSSGESVVQTQLNVIAAPNPFTDRIMFTIASPVSGQAQLEVMNMLGQKVHTVYNGFVQANRNQVVEYRVPAGAPQNLLYILRVGGQQVTGKLLRLNR